MEQRSDEWFQARLGKVTASRVSDVLATIKSGEAVTRSSYRVQLVTERLTNQVTRSYVSEAMQHGIDTEDEARAFYMFSKDNVEEVGFIDHPKIAWAGASPDGLVGDEGMIEIKCVQPHTHTLTLINRDMPNKHLSQIMWQLACCPERKWVDFVSYQPSFPENLKMFVKRIYRDDEYIKRLEDEVQKFLAEVEDTVQFLQQGVQ
jgi:putative phage-type endonuclease